MNKLLNLLESYYEPEKITAIVQAITVDPLIKTALTDEVFLTRYWEVNQNSESVWTAANIAGFAAMFYGEDQQQDLAGSDRYELVMAGKKAIQLNTILSESVKQKESFNKYLATQANDEANTMENVLVYGYGFQKDKNLYLTLLNECLPESKNVSLSIRAILQNSRSVDERMNAYEKVLKGADVRVASKWLNALNVMAFDADAKKLANSWLQENEQIISKQSDSFSVEALFSLATIYQLADRTENGEKVLSQVQMNIKEHAQRAEYLQLIQAPRDAQKKAKNGMFGKELPTAYYVDYALSSDQISFEDMEQLLPEVQENPLAAIRLAGLIRDNKPEQAGQMAVNAIRQLKQQNMKLDHFVSKLVQNWNPARIIRILNQLQLPAEAVQLGNEIRKLRPNDESLLEALIESNQQLQKWDQAEAQAKTLYFKNPTNQQGLYTLAEVYEKSENWKNAFDSWKQYMALSPESSIEVLQHFMQAAVESGNPEEALKCFDEHVIQLGNHAGISYFQGKAFEKISEPSKAEKAYLEGTRQDASFGKNWLALSKLYQAQKQLDKSVETLKTAAVHAPNNVEILISLAKFYLEKHDEETARKIMKQAVVHQDVEFKIALEMLDNLSRLNETQLLYDYAGLMQTQWPNNGKIAHYLAISSQGLGKKNEAIRAFEIATQSSDAIAGWTVDYACALVDDGKEVFDLAKTIPVANYVKALQLLETAQSAEAITMQAKLLYGELIIELGQYQQAFEHYQQLSNSLDGIKPADAIRFQTGLGTSAHFVGKNEIAVAALKEASRDSEKAVYVFQRMAESYQDLQFADEAMQAAKSALSAGPTILSNLSWFAEFAIAMDATDDAKQALEVATELAPDDIDYWIAYAVILAKLEDWENFDEVMLRIKQFPDLTQEQLLKISDLYLDLNEINNALDILQDGLLHMVQQEISPEYLITLALLSYKGNKLVDATQFVQQLLEKRDWDAGVHTFFGDILSGQEKYRAASASYDHACKLIEMEDQDDALFSSLSPQVKNCYAAEWFESLYTVPAITLRWSSIEIVEQKYNEAITQYTKTLSETSVLKESSLVHLTLGAYLLQNEEIIQAVLRVLSNRNQTEMLQNKKLIALAAEIALDRQDAILAGQFIHPALEKGNQGHLISTVQGRLLLQNGEWQRAGEIFELVFGEMNQSGSEKNISSVCECGGILPVSDDVLLQLAMLKYAVALRKWNEATQIRLLLEKHQPCLPVIGLSIIDTDLITVEFKRLSIELQINKHSPSETVYQEAAFSTCMSTLNDIQSVISADQFTRLANRIQLVYRPSLQVIRDTVQMVPNQTDIHYLVPAVRRLDHCEGVAKLAEKSSDDADIRMNLSLCKLNGQADEALIEITSAFNIRPNDPILAAVASMCYEKNAAYQDAYQFIEKALAVWPDEPMWHIRAAELSAKLTQNGKSKKHFALAHEMAPKDNLITNHYVTSLISDNQFQEAYTIIEKAKNDHPEDWQWHVLLADVFEKNGQIADAMEELTDAIEKSNQHALPKLKLANLLLKNGEFDAVNKLVHELPVNADMSEDVVYLQAAALNGLGNPQKAMQILEKYLSENETKSDALMLERTSIVRKMQGERTAIAYAEDLLNQFPESIEGYALISDMHYQCGDFQDAGKYLEKGLNLATQHAQMNYLNGLLAVQNGNLDLAVHSFATTIQQDTSHIEAYKALSETHLRRREFEEAAKVMVQGVENNLNEVSLMLDAAKIFKDSKDYNEAETMLRKASLLKPDDVNIQRQLGAIIALNLVHNQ